MQDRYTGDIGDFVKYGLLRAIKTGKRLGVAWYLHPDDGPSGDGRHINYLKQPDKWRHLDPKLFNALKKIVGGVRSVESIRNSSILGNAVFASDRLDIVDPVRERDAWRRQWFAGVMEQLSGCNLVFADPDNGLYPNDRFNRRTKDSAKRIPLYEAEELAQGRTAIIYHHNTRRLGGHKQEIDWWMNQMPGCTCAYYWQRWSCRTFFIVNPDNRIERRLRQFETTWKCCGQLIYKASGRHRI